MVSARARYPVAFSMVSMNTVRSNVLVSDRACTHALTGSQVLRGMPLLPARHAGIGVLRQNLDAYVTMLALEDLHGRSKETMECTHPIFIHMYKFTATNTSTEPLSSASPETDFVTHRPPFREEWRCKCPSPPAGTPLGSRCQSTAQAACQNTQLAFPKQAYTEALEP